MNSTGVGLGLMISNNLALNLHPNKSQGLIVESKYQVGTTFIFEIEDKCEITNVQDFNCFKNLDENYNCLKINILNQNMKFIDNNKTDRHKEIEEFSNYEKSEESHKKENNSKEITYYNTIFHSEKHEESDTSSKKLPSSAHFLGVNTRSRILNQTESIIQEYIASHSGSFAKSSKGDRFEEKKFSFRNDNNPNLL